jgi:hypothetical protein
MHDPRLGRFFAVDPLAGKYPWNSPYVFSENKVTVHVELEGLEAVFWEFKYDDEGTRIGVAEARRVESNTDKYVSLYFIKNTNGNWHIVPSDYNKSLLLTSSDVISEWEDGNASYQKAIDVHNMGVVGDYFTTVFYTLAGGNYKFGAPKVRPRSIGAKAAKGAKIPLAKEYRIEASLSKKPGKTHGYEWSDADAIARANNSRGKSPQGRFGSKSDSDYAIQQAQQLQIGERALIQANEGNSNVLIGADGSKIPATHIFIEVKPAGNTGTIHAFPAPANYKITPRTTNIKTNDNGEQ